MRNNYKSGTKQMSDEQVLEAVQYHHKFMVNDGYKRNGTVSHLTKALYYENEAKKRGYMQEQITDYCNKRDIAELKKV